MRFKNFRIWRARLPHWRADEVTYYVTFRHSRPLDSDERQALLKAIVSSEDRKLSFQIACVLPERSEMLFRVMNQEDSSPIEFATLIEAAKRKAGKAIIKATGERYPPFWEESYDRIVRDEAEFEERLAAIVDSPVAAELVEDPKEYAQLYWSSRP